MGASDRLLQRAEEAVLRKNYDYAVELYRQVLSTEPDNIKARQSLWATALKRGQEKGFPSKISSTLRGGKVQAQCKVIKAAEKRMGLCIEHLLDDPHHVQVRVLLAQTLEESGHADAAIAEYEVILSGDKNNVAALKCLGALHLGKEEVQKAVDYLERACRLAPQDREVMQRLKDALARKAIVDSSAETRESFRESLKDKTGAEAAQRDQTLVRSADSIDQDIQRLSEEATSAPDERTKVKLYLKISDLYVKKGDLPKAIDVTEMARQVDPADGQLKIRSGDLKIRELDVALQEIKKNVQASPGNAQLEAELREKQKQKLIFQLKEFAQRVADHPTDMDKRYHYGVALYQAGKLDEAIGEFQMSVKDPRRRVESLNFLGRSFCRRGLYDLAINQFQKALELTIKPEVIMDLRYELAGALKKQGQVDQAITEFKKLLEMDISYRDVSKQIEELSKAKGG